MYKPVDKTQTSFLDFDQPMGLHMNPKNRWIQNILSGLPGYQDTPPFDASTQVLFRKRITADMLVEANEYLLERRDDDYNEPPSAGNGMDENSIPQEEEPNKGSLAIDATCAPANTRYLQDVSFLNEAREKMEGLIYQMCKSYGMSLPRRYRRIARKDYLAFSKSRKHTNVGRNTVDIHHVICIRVESV